MRKSNTIIAIKNYCRHYCASGDFQSWNKCHETECPLHPFRKGNNPFRKKKELDPEVKNKLRNNLKKAREVKQKLKKEG